MADDHAPLDDLLRAHLAPGAQDDARADLIRTAAQLELRQAHRQSSWRYRLESGAMLAVAAGQLVWVFGSLFGGR